MRSLKCPRLSFPNCSVLRWHQCYPLERAFDHKLGDKDPENVESIRIHQDPAGLCREDGLTITMVDQAIHTSS